ncbi:TetR/AcrR family transcriptional regulator [Caulobacter hibisci]|uniref:TetR/AcrR family transcriptional regulator n=1 Tax=Caulobacter hibisci TaxID=2035993 RepID=A0ABS0SX27_9CAUL|nr:TetR/AcrR family transcriptional regulator [Caulobacter hibisci]MBI1684197.1 TetR/AcrR family transcriptional regulator [Caulobacter hibisci]
MDDAPPDPTAADTRPARAPANLRKEQARSVETRLAILGAALAEFADHGFDRASTRAIGERAGLHHTLVSYHFGTKEGLWRATAEHFFGQIHAGLPPPPGSAQARDAEAIDRVRGFFRRLLAFIADHPSFHHFMMRETRQAGPRRAWLMQAFVAPMLTQVVADVRASQAEGDLPPGDPVLLYHVLLSLVTGPAALATPLAHFGQIEGQDLVEPYWTLVDQLVFRRKPFRLA